MSTPGPLPLSSSQGAPRGPREFTGSARFEVRRRLGEGGMGVVYEAYDRERRHLVALKTLRFVDAQSVYRFKAEFRALADLEHRNLVRLGELFYDDGVWYFTMELVAGRDFLAHIWDLEDGAGDAHGRATQDQRASAVALGRHRPGGFDEDRLRDALGQLADGLGALHASGKVHRDVKPSNVKVTPKGRVVLMDFGLVTDVSPGPPSDPNVVGTAAYMAPEQAVAPNVGPAADWYAVGVMLYEALTGRLPFGGAPLEILLRKQKEAPVAPDELAPGVAADLAALAMGLLRGDPVARAGAAEVLACAGRRPSAPASPVPTTQAAPFVGRERELEALEDALADVAAGHAVSVLVDGESGIGKTALVRRFLETIEDERPLTLVLSARCYERECMAFKALDGIIDALTRHLCRRDPVEVALLLPSDVGALARLFPVLHRVPAIARMPLSRLKNPLELRGRAFRALRQLLAAVGEHEPVVLVVDDFQWADADSLALLTDVLHPPQAPRVMVVATRRLAAADPGQPPLPGDCRRIWVDRLAPSEARQLVKLLRPGDADGAGSSIAEDAGGHPLFIHELVRHEATVGAPARGQVRLDDALWSRVARLEAPARRVLEVVAVAGAPIAQFAVAHAAGLEPGPCAKQLGSLRAAMLVRTTGVRGHDTVETYHDRIRETVLARVAATRRQRMHALLAAALESTGAAQTDPLTLVRHLEAAGEAERAAELAERAARRAAELYAFDQAAELYATVLRLGARAPAEARALEHKRAEALAHAGRGPEAAEAYLRAAEGAEPDERFERRRRAAEQLLVSGHLKGGLAALDDVLADVGQRRPGPLGARVSLVGRTLWLGVRGLGFKPRSAATIPARELMTLDVFRSVALGLAMIDSVMGANYQTRALLRALELGEPTRLAHALAFASLQRASLGSRHFPVAERMADAARRIAADRDDPTLNAWIRAMAGALDYFAGRYLRGIDRLAEAEQMFREHTMGTTSELNHVHVFQLFCLRRVGAFGELRALYQEYTRDADRRGDRYVETTLIWAGNLGWLAAGDLDFARREVERATWSPPADGYHLQHWLALRARFERALYDDDQARAPDLAADLDAFGRSQFTRVQIPRAETEWMRGRLALWHGGPTGVAAARRAAAKLRKERVRYADTWAALLEAEAALEAGDKDAAPGLFRAASSLGEESEQPLISAIARRDLGRLLGGPGGDAMADEADAWLTERGVADPGRLASVLTGRRDDR